MTAANEQTGPHIAADAPVRLCVPVCVGRATELPAAVARATAVADIIELRLDCLADHTELAAARAALAALLRTRARPFIITLRPPAQGGRAALTERDRAAFWRACWPDWHADPAARPDYVDVELDLLEAAGPAPTDAPRATPLAAAESHWPDFNTPPPGVTLICSYHDFARVPADLDALYARMAHTTAPILKLAAHVHDATDCLALLQLLARARRAGRAFIPVAMGPAGLLTRVLGPARGAFLTYGALTDAQATAPGQVSAAELRARYRLHALDAQTDIYGLVGAPVAHSRSPHMHNAAFAATGLNAVYLPFEVQDVAAFMQRMAHPRTRELDWRLRGLSVTAPHKQAIMAHLDWLDPVAAAVGAVNTVVGTASELHGYNTDAPAALVPVQTRLELRGARVAVIGAGGGARAVLWGLRRAGAQPTVCARNVARARPDARKFDAACQDLHTAQFAGFDLVVNTTPLGTRGAAERETPATVAQLRGARAAYDLVYNPPDTSFMQAARAAGCEIVVGGLAMLVAQAAAQFALWTGTAAPLDVLHNAAARTLSTGDS